MTATDAAHADATPVQLSQPTIVQAFRDQVHEHGDAIAMRRRGSDGWETLTWDDYGQGVAEVLAGLAERGAGPGDRVAILSANRVEWHLADLATLSLGGVTVPIYQTSSPTQVAYVLGNAEARACFVENREQLEKVLEVRDQVPK